MCAVRGIPIYGPIYGIVARENLAATLSSPTLFRWLLFLRGAIPGRSAIMAGSR